MTLQEMERVKRTVIRKYPIFASISLFNVPIVGDKNIATAAVVGEENEHGEIVLKGIKYNSEFFDNLSFEQQVFVLAHETCHIAFKHFARGKKIVDNDIERRYQEYCDKVTDENLREVEKVRLHKKYNNMWNIATDACINAFLEKDGLKMPRDVIDKRTGQKMQFVDIKDGLFRKSEVIYESLVKREEEDRKQNNSGNELGEKQSSTVGGGLDNIDIDNYQGIDSHEEWNNSMPDKKNDEKKDLEQDKKEEQDKELKQDEKDDDKEKKKSFLDKIKEVLSGKKDNKDKTVSKEDIEEDEQVVDEIDKEEEVEKQNDKNGSDDISPNEDEVFKQNEIEREARTKKMNNNAFNKITEVAGVNHVNYEKPILSWKQLLIRSIEEEVESWGYRRANRSNPNSRVEDTIQDERSTTEIILDTSGSVSDELLRSFLRQLVPMFKETQIKVGCFGEVFHGFTELKSIEQVKQFRALRDNGGTNYEAAVTAFSKDNGTARINKIVFTDGRLDSNYNHVQKTKVDNIIWIVFGNRMNFKPISGRIIKVEDKDLNRMINFSEKDEFDMNNYLNDNKTIRRR